MADEKVEYQRCSRVSDDEESSTSFLTENHDKYITSLRQENHLRTLASRGYLILLHVILLATYILIAIKYLQPAGKETRYDGFFTPTEAPIFYEQKSIQTPFSFANNTFLDSYAGSSPDIDEKWDKILGVGIIRLTEGEADRLPQKTAKLYGGKEGEYAGFLEMFHQLHCLNRLRKHFYDPTVRLDGDEPESFTRNHDEHCFDYIRRNLMCYSDVSILPIGWDTKDEAYYATFDTTVQKTCRNFDAIYKWAKGRQTPWTPPGNGGIDLHISNE